MKTVKALFLATVLLCFGSIPVMAAEIPAVSSGEVVYDYAGLFDSAETANLADLGKTFEAYYGMEVVILTSQIPLDTSSEDFAWGFYDQNGFGAGQELSGIILYINMHESDRGVWVLTNGEAYSQIPDSYVNGPLLDDIFDCLVEGDYYGGGLAFLMGIFDRMESITPELEKPVLVETGVDTSLKVYDFAGVLSPGQIGELSAKAEQIAASRAIDVAVILINDSKGLSATAYADDFYDYNGFGSGNSYSGILLLMNTDTGEIAVSTSGQMIALFEDSHIDTLLKKIYASSSLENYTQAAEDYLETVDYWLSKVKNGRIRLPLRERHSAGAIAGVSLFIGAAVSLLVTSSLVFSHKRSLKAASPKQHYVDEKGLMLTQKQDQFVTTFTTKTPIPKQNSGGGGGFGGGSSHTSSSGRSHGGGSFGGGGSRGGGGRSF